MAPLDSFIQSMSQNPYIKGAIQGVQGITSPIEKLAQSATQTLSPKHTKVDGQLSQNIVHAATTPIQDTPVGQGLLHPGSNESVNIALGMAGDAGAGRVKEGADLPPTQANPNMGMPPGKTITRINLKPSVHGAGREQAVQDTVNKFVPGKTATEQYANLQPTMDNLGNQIQQIMQQNPKQAPINQVMNDYDKNLNNAGIYRTMKMPKDVVQKEALNYITDLYNGATGESKDVVPQAISDNALYNLKQSVNQDAQSIYKKIDNGTSLTEREKVILAARQTIDDTLSTLHPDVKDLTTKQSHLYDAAESLYKGREAEMNMPKESLLDKARKNPFTAPIATAATGVGLLNFPNIAGAATGLAQEIGNIFDKKDSTEPGTPSTSSTAQKYNITTPLDDGTLISEKQQADRQGALQQQIGEAKLTNPVKAAQLQGAYDSNATEFNSQNNLRQMASATKTLVASANNASNDLQGADPSIINAVSKGYDYLKKANNGKYAKLAADLQSLENLGNVDLTTAKSAEALQAAIDGIVKNRQLQMQSAQTQYSGGTVKAIVPVMSPPPPPTQSSVNWQQNDPRVQAVMSGSNLPPTQGLQTP